MTRWRRLGCLLVAAALVVLTVGACSGKSGGTGGPVVVTITEKGGSISASSDLVKADLGQKIVFKVTTDATDEIHVHSVPDHEFEIRPGSEQTFSFSVDTPGSIEVESHGLDEVILKLEIG